MTMLGHGATGAPAPSPALAVLLSCWSDMAAALAAPGLSEAEVAATNARGRAILILLPILPLAPTDIGPVLRLLSIASRDSFLSHNELEAVLASLAGNFHTQQVQP